ncbi:MAG: 4-hydroxythreonine-4-phosphate dehydrogenase PdxA [Lysobacteraceae bacterium]
MAALPRLALLPGEPGGIGPELVVKLAQRALPASLLCFGDPDHLINTALSLRLPLSCDLVSASALEQPLPAHRPGRLTVMPFPHPNLPVAGTASPDNAASLFAALEAATDACLSGQLDGMVTGPLQKASLNADRPFTGLTEWLMQRAGSDDVVMMLANPDLRVALLTTHLPLRDVPDAITGERLQSRLGILHRALHQNFGIASPRIAVLGLNPHAGEDGLLGDEELQVITPALAMLRAGGMDLIGPLPADTAFLPQRLREFDAVFAMYHDQGLPVLKHSGFEQAVNISLGLPFVRVAVDHGTALDRAGRGNADPGSLIAATETAIRMANTRRDAA